MEFIIGLFILYAFFYAGTALFTAVGKYLDTSRHAHYVVGIAVLLLGLACTILLAGDKVGCLIDNPTTWLESCLTARKS